MFKPKFGQGWVYFSALSVAAACGSTTNGQIGAGAGANAGYGAGAGAASSAFGQGGTSSLNNGSGYDTYPGSGTTFAGAPLPAGVGPDTANTCPTPPPITPAPHVLAESTICYYGDTPDPSTPAATAEEILEVVNDKTVVHIRVTFDPAFVDNTYGDTAVGWGSSSTTNTMGAPPAPGSAPPSPGTKGSPQMGATGMTMGMGMGAGGPPMMTPHGHTFDDLVGSDHLELEMFDTAGNMDLHVAVDYISVDPDKPCGYGTLGVNGGDGMVFSGNGNAILAVSTSLDRDLNACGYCLTENSPATDSDYTPNPEYPKWDYRVVYELWVDASAFGSAGFEKALVSFVHASPSKIGTDTVDVTPKPCPPGWDQPKCDPSLAAEGCGSASGGSTGSGGSGGIPNDSGICPAGWVPDLESEGRFCVKE